MNHRSVDLLRPPGGEFNSMSQSLDHSANRSSDQSLFDLSGRVAVVTGGTTGLGRAIAMGLAEAGADVIASSRRIAEVEKAAAEIEALGRRSLRVTSDVLSRASLQALHDAVLSAFG